MQGSGVAQRSVGGTAIALERVRLDYAETWDTNIRDIGMEVIDKRQVRGWLSDDSARSPITLRAAWRDVSRSPSVEHRRLSAHCRSGECRVGTLERGSDTIPLLVGFVFHNLSGAQKITRMAMFPEVRTGPNAQISYHALFDTDGRDNYTVDIDLVLVDPSIIAGQYNASATSEAGKPYAAVPLEWENGILALQGFDVRFTNGSHQLQEFAIEELRGTNAVKAVYFSDTNNDDPVAATLWWADLKAPGIQVIPFDRPLPTTKPVQGGPTPELNPSVRPTSKPPTSKPPTSKPPTSKPKTVTPIPKHNPSPQNKLPGALPKAKLF